LRARAEAVLRDAPRTAGWAENVVKLKASGLVKAADAVLVAVGEGGGFEVEGRGDAEVVAKAVTWMQAEEKAVRSAAEKAAEQARARGESLEAAERRAEKAEAEFVRLQAEVEDLKVRCAVFETRAAEAGGGAEAVRVRDREIEVLRARVEMLQGEVSAARAEALETVELRERGLPDGGAGDRKDVESGGAGGGGGGGDARVASARESELRDELGRSRAREARLRRALLRTQLEDLVVEEAQARTRAMLRAKGTWPPVQCDEGWRLDEAGKRLADAARSAAVLRVVTIGGPGGRAVQRPGLTASSDDALGVLASVKPV
jgi:hypothetical protein